MFRSSWSVFDGPHSDSYPAICPVAGCRFHFDGSLEDVAIERHRGAHAADEWREVVAGVEKRRADAEHAHRVSLNAFDADLARLARWS